MTDAVRDRWASWILERRFGGDQALTEETLRHLGPVRDRVLEGAEIREGDVVLDVGCGDGLIAFGALSLVGERGKVIFSDVSQDLLDVSREVAEEAGELDRCEFVLADAKDLEPIGGESVDVVTTRSVLIYLSEKEQALNAFHRVLRPGGRLSMFEPINSFAFPEPDERFWGFDVTPVADLKRKVSEAYGRLEDGDRTLVDFDERDLIEFADRAGFSQVELSYEVKVAHGAGACWDAGHASWDAFLNMAPNPLARTLAEVLEEALTPAESERFVGHVRPLFEALDGTNRSAVAYLRARK